MGLLASLAPRELRDLTDSEWLLRALAGGGSSTYTGKNVGIVDSLKQATVFRCVTILTETIATLPLLVYKRLDEGSKERAPAHYLHDILRYSPNPEMTAAEYWETAIGHVELWGNHYSEIQRNGAGRIAALWPLRADRMRVLRDQASGELRYQYTMPSGEMPILKPYQVMHLRGYSLDGVNGLSRIAQAREGIALALGAEELGARRMGNDASPSGVLEVDGRLKEDAAKRLLESWNAAHQGLSKAGRIAVLEEGVKWRQMGMTASDAQYIETRKFQREEIATIFGIPPHKVGILDRATFSNIENQAIEFVTDAIRPRCVRIEQRVYQDLFTEEGQRGYFAEFLIDGLLRGDLASRYAAYQIGKQNGWLCADDIRAMENQNPLPEGQGKTYWRPANMVPADAPFIPPKQQPGASG